MNQVAVRRLNQRWTSLDLLEVAGVEEHSVQVAATAIDALNAEFPAAQHKNRTEACERPMEMLMDCSKHFSESITTKYNAPVGQRAFEIAAGLPNAGQRDYSAFI